MQQLRQNKGFEFLKHYLKEEGHRINGDLYSYPEDFIVKELPIDNIKLSNHLFRQPNYPSGDKKKFKRY